MIRAAPGLRTVYAVRYDLLHPKALRAALIKQMGSDYSMPTERQVRRWISGDSPWPGWALRAVDELMSTQQNAPLVEASGADLADVVATILEERLRQFEDVLDCEQLARLFQTTVEKQDAEQEMSPPWKAALGYANAVNHRQLQIDC